MMHGTTNIKEVRVSSVSLMNQLQILKIV